MDKADENRRKANKLNNNAEMLDVDACSMFNKKIKVEHIQQLCEKINENGIDVEKDVIQELLDKKRIIKLFEGLPKFLRVFHEGLLYFQCINCTP